jgi:hypothetical protein
VFALRRESKTAACQAIIQISLQSISCCSHGMIRLPERSCRVNTWNNSN